jgi:VIT1/CCC1 family predicted Fe2+/Mn2+ transporter
MEKKLTTPIFVILGLAILGLSGALSVKEDTPLWLLSGVGAIGLAALVVHTIESYLKK